jgi:hypothetical protein
MAYGRTFRGDARIYNPAATAKLMEEKPNLEGASECKVWTYDKALYNTTGEVKKLEYLREEEKPQKLSCHADNNGRLAWDKKDMRRYVQ